MNVTITVHMPNTAGDKYATTKTFSNPTDYTESMNGTRLTITMVGAIHVFVNMPYHIVRLTT